MPGSQPAAKAAKPAAERIIALDYLRGFFIFVIIIDHLSRWPSGWAVLTGQGVLWSSAAEGFFIISGLLIGYIRGYKERRKPLVEVGRKLLARAALLYGWSVGLSLAYIWAIWHLAVDPSLRPDMFFARSDWPEAIRQVLIQNYVAGWAYFLKLYWIMLLLAPLAIWLLRRRLAWLLAVISAAVYGLGVVNGADWMQWQILFFLPAIAGYYLEPIRIWLDRQTPAWRRTASRLFVGGFAVTAAASVFWSLGWPPAAVLGLASDSYLSFKQAIDPLFGRFPVTPWRIIVAFGWFIALLIIFQRLVPFIKRYLAWLLLTFGTRSLTAYTLHGFILLPVQLLVPVVNNAWFNSLLGLAVVLLLWWLLRLRFVQAVFPR